MNIISLESIHGTFGELSTAIKLRKLAEALPLKAAHRVCARAKGQGRLPAISAQVVLGREVRRYNGLGSRLWVACLCAALYVLRTNRKMKMAVARNGMAMGAVWWVFKHQQNN